MAYLSCVIHLWDVEVLKGNKKLTDNIWFIHILTIIPRVRVGYEMVDSQLDATHLVGHNHLISNKHEWNNCFIKNAHKISMNLPDFILLEQTGKDKGLQLFTCHTSVKTVNARTDWMVEKSEHYGDEHF